jgi:zinc transporter
MDGRALLVSIVALIFLPLTFITGLLGMNVPIPAQGSHAAFWIVLGGCALVTLLGIGWFVRRRWIGRDVSVE